jgi:hypothetical protein
VQRVDHLAALLTEGGLLHHPTGEDPVELYVDGKPFSDGGQSGGEGSVLVHLCGRRWGRRRFVECVRELADDPPGQSERRLTMEELDGCVCLMRRGGGDGREDCGREGGRGERVPEPDMAVAFGPECIRESKF